MSTEVETLTLPPVNQLQTGPGEERANTPSGTAQPTPLSYAQRRVWFMEQLEPNSPAYNMQTVVRLRGQLNIPALGQALNCIVARHETLRARFDVQEGQPVQLVEEGLRLGLSVIDLQKLPVSEQEAEWRRRAQAAMNTPFNLRAGPLLRATLLRFSPQEHVLILDMHHIISDEWSFRLFFRELEAFYTTVVTGEALDVPDLPIQYGDYAAWQDEALESGAFDQAVSFWKEHLNGASAAELPTDHARRVVPNAQGTLQCRPFGPELTASLKQLARREGVTWFMLLFAAFDVLLYRYTRRTDFIVGTPVAGRTRIETENLIGFFVNTLPLRISLSAEMTFTQLLAKARETALAAFSFQELPFDKLVEILRPERVAHATPFINLLFMTQAGLGEPPELPGLKVEFLPAGVGPSKFDLSLAVWEDEAGAMAEVLYKRELFDPDTVAGLLEHYEALLKGIVKNPHARLCELPLMNDDERVRVLEQWNATQVEYPREACVHELFEQQAQSTPEALALEFGDKALTYGELNAWANRVARRLLKLGARPGRPIALCAERSFEMVAGLLGILKAGGAYAPLDPLLPKARLAELLDDLQSPMLVLTHTRLLECLPQGAGTGCVCLETERESLKAEGADNPGVNPGAESVAFISYTSGSTGRPKGVCVPHRAMVRLVRNPNYVSLGANEVLLQLAPLAFDASTFEIWGALLNGGRLAIFPPGLPSLSQLEETLRQHKVTTIWLTSGLFNQIVDGRPQCLSGLRQVLTGGDVLSPPHVAKALSFLKAGALINGYGPTENATFTACYRIPQDFEGVDPVPIGRPISNTTCYVLDEQGRPVPAGVPGELFAGGDGVACGYWNATEMTAEKFVPNPFVPGTRMYRTGDLVRWNADGTLQFLGRLTEQVKVRGFRVEPGEIESVLLEHPEVERCAVVARPDAAGTKQLVAFFVPRHAQAPEEEPLREFLRERLPDYMVPAFMVALPELPLSHTGKVNRAALSQLELKRLPREEAAAPRDEIEGKLQALWEEVLAVKPIGVHDKFFALGGHSLLAVRLIARVEQQFNTRLKVATLLQHPTIASLAAVLRGTARPDTRSSIVPIQPEGSKPPLFLVHGAGGGMLWGYGNLAKHLGLDQPVFAFNSRGLDGEEEPTSIEALAQSYFADLKSFQPHGPYRLGGYCFGGVVAYEVACRLERGGDKVAFLGLINSTAPNSSYTSFRWTPQSAVRFTTNILRRAFYTWRAHPERLPQFLRWKTRRFTRRLGSLAPVSHALANGEFSPDDWIDLSEFSEIERRLWRIHLPALQSYQPQPYGGQVTLFRSPVHLLRCSFQSHYGWADFARGGVVLRVIPGAHESVMEEPGVRALARAFTERLAIHASSGT